MPSIKIINVLRDDDFDSVFNVFEGTSAKEVILILPQNSRFSKNSEHFMLIKQKAEELEKVVNIMSEDVGLKDFVEDLGFKFLEIEKPKKKTVKAKKEIKADSVPTTLVGKRGMADIIRPVADMKIDIDPEEKKDEEEVEVRKEEETSLEEDTPLVEPAAPLIEETDPHVEEETVAPEIPVEEKIPAPTIEPLGKSKSSDLENLWFGLADASKRIKEKAAVMGGSSDRIKLSKKKKFIAYSTLATVIVVVSLFTVFSKAHIVLRPEKQAINFEIELTASTETSSPDSIKNTIPGQLIIVRDESQGSFEASGKDDVVRKSRGTIRIHNDLSISQILIATTRFKSPDGFIYRIPKTVTIAGNGTLEVEIIADRAGIDFKELKGTRFEVPGFQEANLTDKYENIYAEAITGIDGGFIGETALVTEEDFNKAKDSLVNKSLNKILDELKDRIKDIGLIDVNSIAELKEIDSTAEADDVAESFDLNIVVEGKTMLIDKEHVLAILNAYLERSGNLMVIEELTDITYENSEFINDEKAVTFRVKVDGQASPKIDTTQITNNLLGKDEDEITQYIRSIEEVTSARILLSPFWVKNLPKKAERVTIELEY